MNGTCVICGNSTRRKPDAKRPCCARCEKTAPMAIQCPGLFTKGPAAIVARKVESLVAAQGGTQ